MATLNMDTTTIGYSKGGVDALINTIESSIEADAKKVDPDTSKAYKTLITTLRKYWDGDDEANFEADLKACAQTLATKLRNYKSILKDVLTKYKSQFAKFQKNNYAKGTIKLS